MVSDPLVVIVTVPLDGSDKSGHFTEKNVCIFFDVLTIWMVFNNEKLVCAIFLLNFHT